MAERTCVVGRTTHPREELVRLVASPDGEVVVDVRGNLPGRGVWVLPTAERLAGLARKRGFVEKQLGARLDPDKVRRDVHAAVVKGVRDGLSIAAAAGALVPGQDRLVKALQEGRVEVVVTASDTAERTLRSIEGAASLDDVPIVALPLDADAVGAQIGRGRTAVVGVPHARPTTLLRHRLRWLSALG